MRSALPTTSSSVSHSLCRLKPPDWIRAISNRLFTSRVVLSTCWRISLACGACFEPSLARSRVRISAPGQTARSAEYADRATGRRAASYAGFPARWSAGPVLRWRSVVRRSRALATSRVKVSSSRCCSGIINWRRFSGSTTSSPQVRAALFRGKI